jgi:hypothetical protein
MDDWFTACQKPVSPDNKTMSAAQVIEQIKELSANERAQVARFIAVQPTTKAWRYFDQKKAIHLIKTSQLYLQRLDLLTDYYEGDPYEGNPTFSLIEGDIYAHSQVFGHADEASIRKEFEYERKATFVSCWQMSDYESWFMWKQYCQRGGGFAVQTTIKRLSALADEKSLLLHNVKYLDHWADNSLVHTIPCQVFVKPCWFSDEKEIRLALFHSECINGIMDERRENALARLKDHELIETNLANVVEQIVLNPFSCECQKKEVVGLVESLRPELKSRLCESGITNKPVLSQFQDGY